ncbi:DUF6751 family protein [Anaerostipes sp. AF04-45]|uniref:DUF6751 family protein n=1 Tax=Anaerostipes sp. AF04-45 TaxID=2292912 RepID=UPI000E490C2E|nr:DUF6751 family protein [Anaerostipes sp. AF04-45]RGH20324.1 hypothetical protein DWV34_16790 [Anaerostipes sp. AF04-45]
MVTNADITLYNKVYDRDAGANRYYRTVLKGVNWQDTTAVQPTDKGIVSADVAEIYIPFAVETEKQFRKLKNFVQEPEKTGFFTVEAGDLVVQGIVGDELTSAKDEERMKNTYDDVRTIAVVETNDNGSPEMQHWKVTAE